ncbi:hypothetical protein L7F22_028106 [Adiantum nelumboides]|nr:hypothetical protein [Adiantum nelumboides]
MLKKERRVLILDIEGLLLKSLEIQHGDDIPSWTGHMRFIKEDEICFAISPDVDVFLDFCFHYFEVWIWSCYNLDKAQHIIQTCFPSHHSHFMMLLSNKNCQNSNIMLGYKRVYLKNLSLVWDMFHDLHAENTLIFYDSPYRVMWNMQGTYLIFPKMWRQLCGICKAHTLSFQKCGDSHR